MKSRASVLLLLTLAAFFTVSTAGSSSYNGNAERGLPTPLPSGELINALRGIAGGLSPEVILKIIVETMAGPNSGDPKDSPASWLLTKVLNQLMDAIRGSPGTDAYFFKLNEVLSRIIADGASNGVLAQGIAFLRDVLEKIAKAFASVSNGTESPIPSLKEIADGIVRIVEYEHALEKRSEASKAPAAGCGKHLMNLSPCYGPLMNPPTANSSLDYSRCCKAAVQVLNGAGGGGSCICHLLRDPLLLGFPFSLSDIGKLFHACPVLHSSSDAALSDFDINKTCRGNLPPLVMYAASSPSDASPSAPPAGPSLPRKVLPRSPESSGTAPVRVFSTLSVVGIMFSFLTLFFS